LLIRRIRELLYEQGFTISGARNKLDSQPAPDVQSDQAGGAAFDPVALRNELQSILGLLRA
jgi:hypothetical protein